MSLFACKGRYTAALQAEGDSVAFKYTTLLDVVRYDGYTVASLKNPWKEGLTLHQYILGGNRRQTFIHQNDLKVSPALQHFLEFKCSGASLTFRIVHVLRVAKHYLFDNRTHSLAYIRDLANLYLFLYPGDLDIF